MHESNELPRYEIAEANHKVEAAKAVRKKLDNEIKLQLIAEVIIKEFLTLIRSKDKKSLRKLKNQKRR